MARYLFDANMDIMPIGAGLFLTGPLSTNFSETVSEIFTQRIFQLSFEKIWKIFLELSRGQARLYERADRRTDGRRWRQ